MTKLMIKERLAGLNRKIEELQQQMAPLLKERDKLRAKLIEALAKEETT